MKPWRSAESGNLRLASDSGLSPVHLRAIQPLLEGDKSLKAIAEELALTPDAFREMRRKREFAEEYRRQLARLEVEAFDYPIARRVERIAALNETWLKLKEDIAKRMVPRNDQIYALIALQQAAAKELGQDVQRVELGGRLEIEQAVRVIRFERLEPRPELFAGIEPDASAQDDAIDAEFSDVNRALLAAGIRIEQGAALPEELTALRIAIAERGLNPEEVLTDPQFRIVYGREKGHPVGEGDVQ